MHPFEYDRIWIRNRLIIENDKKKYTNFEDSIFGSYTKAREMKFVWQVGEHVYSMGTKGHKVISTKKYRFCYFTPGREKPSNNRKR